MHKMSWHHGTLSIIERLPSSAVGNPRFLCFVSDNGETGVSFRTAVDSMHGYGVQNFEGKKVKVIVGTHYGKQTLKHIELEN